jgi:4-coumarate--CoA ligase
MGDEIKYIKSPYPYRPTLPVKSIWHAVFDDEPSLLGDGARSDDDIVYREPYNDQCMTFAQVRDLSKRLAYGFLNELGMKKGDTILLFGLNSLYYPAFILASQAARLTLTCANPTYLKDDLVFQIENAKATVVVTDRNGLAVTNEAVAKINFDKSKVFAFEHEGLPGLKSIWELAKGKAHEPLPLKPGEENEVAVMCVARLLTGLLLTSLPDATRAEPLGVPKAVSSLMYVS